MVSHILANQVCNSDLFSSIPCHWDSSAKVTLVDVAIVAEPAWYWPQLMVAILFGGAECMFFFVLVRAHRREFDEIHGLTVFSFKDKLLPPFKRKKQSENQKRKEERERVQARRKEEEGKARAKAHARFNLMRLAALSRPDWLYVVGGFTSLLAAAGGTVYYSSRYLCFDDNKPYVCCTDHR
jgi:hypothetical protein